MDKLQALISRLSGTDFPTVRTAYITRAREEHGRVSATLVGMMERGMVEIDASVDAVMTDDGRPIMRFAGRALVHTPEVHAKLQMEALKAAKKQQDAKEAATRGELKPPPPGEALASVLCPSCRATMAKSPVCPNCEKGQAGYKIICICTQCGHEVYL